MYIMTNGITINELSLFLFLFVFYNPSLLLITSAVTCQPIVFVSDRARANKEIEHDGIEGERKKKPKVISSLREPEL